MRIQMLRITLCNMKLFVSVFINSKVLSRRYK